jgi:hypothetical protein
MQPLEVKSVVKRDDNLFHVELQAADGTRLKLLSPNPLDLKVGAFYTLTETNPPKAKGK